MNPRFEKFLKKAEPKKKSTKNENADGENVDLFTEVDQTQALIEERLIVGETLSLFQVYREQGTKKWLGQDYPAARASFNLINKTLHPERPLARGIAILAAKGTSFEDKRLACITLAKNLLSGEVTGEVTLLAEPENPFDPNAVAIISLELNQMLGYIPRAKDVNETYGQALAEGKFCGGYVIETKRSQLKGEENAMIVIATGWL